MLFRKIEKDIEEYFITKPNKVMIIDGARQVGKSYIIRHLGKKHFKNCIEVNMLEDALGAKRFKDVQDVNDFYFQLSSFAGDRMNKKDDTLIFIDEIQEYPNLLTMLKFLNQDDRFTYIASGSLLGITLAKTSSIPMGSIFIKKMYPLDFEEFLYANGFNAFAIDVIKNKFMNLESLDEKTHQNIFRHFKEFLLVGGLPEAVNTYLENRNISKVRAIQDEIHMFYADDASKYSNQQKLKVRRIFDMIPSTLQNKKKRIVVQDIDDIKGKTFSHYADEFDYLINSGIALEVKAISTPSFPLIEVTGKNLLKLYLNDVGILSNIYYGNNINSILNNEPNINLGTIYESVVASELKAHKKNLYYYDNKNNGEVDFLIDDYDSLSVIPIEIKSGKDYTIHSALNKFLSNPSYNVKKAYVLNNNREVKEKFGKIYLPIYYVMFI